MYSHSLRQAALGAPIPYPSHQAPAITLQATPSVPSATPLLRYYLRKNTSNTLAHHVSGLPLLCSPTPTSLIITFLLVDAS